MDKALSACVLKFDHIKNNLEFKIVISYKDITMLDLYRKLNNAELSSYVWQLFEYLKCFNFYIMSKNAFINIRQYYTNVKKASAALHDNV